MVVCQVSSEMQEEVLSLLWNWCYTCNFHVQYLSYVISVQLPLNYCCHTLSMASLKVWLHHSVSAQAKDFPHPCFKQTMFSVTSMCGFKVCVGNPWIVQIHSLLIHTTLVWPQFQVGGTKNTAYISLLKHTSAAPWYHRRWFWPISTPPPPQNFERASNPSFTKLAYGSPKTVKNREIHTYSSELTAL